ncbi:hypothetical protein [Leucobacter sp. NPDC077196]|uniref:hypothetical protein n=1 Tax=Leucobacter sp. NPDC077196 TaxID=3154959 RepID=UPI0034423E7F
MTTKAALMDGHAPEVSLTRLTAQRLICLTLAWDQIPESISMEGGPDRILREPVCAILVKTDIGWVLLDTGTDARGVDHDRGDRDEGEAGGDSRAGRVGEHCHRNHAAHAREDTFIAMSPRGACAPIPRRTGALGRP